MNSKDDDRALQCIKGSWPGLTNRAAFAAFMLAIQERLVYFRMLLRKANG